MSKKKARNYLKLRAFLEVGSGFEPLYLVLQTSA